MSFYAILLLGVGVSADAFAVAICKGLSLKKFSLKVALIIGLFFGGFQAGMTAIGWKLGFQFKDLIVSIDHWIAFIILAILGGKMLYDALQSSSDGDCGCEEFTINLKEMIILSVATSIDALAVGISLALDGTGIFLPTVVIGITTFLFSFAAVYIGHKSGSYFQKISEIAGGVILILIGINILLEHTVFI